MNKYINADESPTSRSNILDLLKLNLLNYQNMVESHSMKLGIQICLDEINKISSADFVQVVRCKDCKHRFESDVYFPNNCCDLTYLAIKPTDYCSNAERR